MYFNLEKTINRKHKVLKLDPPKMYTNLIDSFSSPTAPRAEGLLHLDFPSFCHQFCHNLKACDWSSCPKAHLSLVETGSNVSEEGQVLGSKGGNAIFSTSLQKLV